MIDRRAFVSMIAAGAATSLLQSAAAAQPVPKARNIVLVHGVFRRRLVLVRSHRQTPSRRVSKSLRCRTH